MAITGPSGSGKSTLLGLIAGLDAPSTGRIIVDGVDITALDEDALARLRGRRIGFVFQFFHLLPSLTALENMLVPMEIAGVARCASPRDGAPRRSRSLRTRPSLSVAALRRRTTARRYRPGAGQRTAAAAGRRADRKSGQRDRTADHRSAARRAIDSRGTTLVLVTHDPELASVAHMSRWRFATGGSYQPPSRCVRRRSRCSPADPGPRIPDPDRMSFVLRR